MRPTLFPPQLVLTRLTRCFRLRAGGIPGVRFKVVKVSGVGLLALWKEKKVRRHSRRRVLNTDELRVRRRSPVRRFWSDSEFIRLLPATSLCHPVSSCRWIDWIGEGIEAASGGKIDESPEILLRRSARLFSSLRVSSSIGRMAECS